MEQADIMDDRTSPPGNPPIYTETIPLAAGYYVYRFWAGDGACLYVGRVGDKGPRPPQVRFGYHRRTKSWWPDVARIDIAELPDHPAVVTEESVQIEALRPLHNRRRGNCTHDLSLPGAVRSGSGSCAECARERAREHYRSAAGQAYEASPARKAAKAERDRNRPKQIRPSGTARALAAKRRPSSGQAPLWG